MNNEENEGGFISHLTELRKRLINSFLFLFLFFIGCYFFAENIYGFLVDPFAKAVKDDGSERRLIFTALHETFRQVKKVSCNAVKINLLSDPSSLTALAKGSTKNPYIFSAKK